MRRLNPASNLFAPFAARRMLQALLATVALCTTMALRAESPGTPPEVPGPQSEEMRVAKQLHKEYMDLQQRLATIQQQTVQAHPELQKQEQELQALMMSKMSSSTGVNAGEEMAAINEIEQKLRNKDTPDNERQKLMQDYHQRAKAFREAQMQVMQDPEVQQARDALMQATTAAMKQEDPQTGSLIDQLKQKEAALQKLMDSRGREK